MRASTSRAGLLSSDLKPEKNVGFTCLLWRVGSDGAVVGRHGSAFDGHWGIGLPSCGPSVMSIELELPSVSPGSGRSQADAGFQRTPG
ncbi:MAG: hypothetical protein CMJ81_08965 [Planctomycetaceae bacterium]|nr:hypothetical protein [Planctomycetaceae bacterium]